MTIIVSAVSTRKSPRRKVLMAAGIVTMGFMVGVSPSANFSSNPLRNVANMGLIYGLLSSLLTAIHAVMGKTQVNRKITIVQLAYNNNLIGSCLLIPFILINGEAEKLQTMILFREDGQFKVFLLGGAVTGLFGVFLSLAGLLSIKVTSPVTHMFSAVRRFTHAAVPFVSDWCANHQAARSVLQTALGVFIFGDILTVYVILCDTAFKLHTHPTIPNSHRVGSLALISCGTLYFTWVQSANARVAPPPPARPMTEKLTHDLEKQ